MTNGPLALSWSGGKDSALALQALREAGTPPRVLLTTVDEASGSVAHHGVPGPLLRRQAELAGLDVVAIPVPHAASNETYEQRLREAFARPPLDTVTTVAFGDLFLEDLRAYRERRLMEAGLRAAFPLWGRDTERLARAFVTDGFEAVLVSVDGEQLSHDFLGRDYDDGLLDELPAGVDPCGERGEFHTFVTAGPVLDGTVSVERGGARSDGRFAWLQLA